MTTSVTPSDLIEIRYRRQYWQEYVRMSGFAPYMGTSPTTIIQRLFEAQSSGKSITIPLVSRLKNSGVNGNVRLGGREEQLGKHSHSVTVQFRRNAVELSKQEEHYDFSNAREAVQPLLKEWSMSMLRNDIIDALFSTSASGIAAQTFHVPLDTDRNAQVGATAANTWLAANADRVLFGHVKSNNSSNNWANSLANITNTSDKFSTSSLSLMKRMAKLADPHIRPIRLDDGSGREFFQCFANSYAFRDLKNDPAMIAANRDARAREGGSMEKNPLFQDGDLQWDGVNVREIPEIPVISSAGSGSIDVGLVALCGAQAIAVAWGQEPAFKRKKEDDYEFLTGVAVEEMLGVNKIQRKDGSTSTVYDHGMVTGAFAAVAD